MIFLAICEVFKKIFKIAKKILDKFQYNELKYDIYQSSINSEVFAFTLIKAIYIKTIIRIW